MANDQEGLSVPVIDISVLMAQATSEDVQRAAEAGELTKTIEELRAAATEWGFFYIANHGVSDEDVAALRANSRSFFALPKDIKRTINRHAENSRGYFDFELTKNKTDWKEGFDFGGRHEDENGNGNADRHNAFNEKNQWLEDHHLPGFRASMQAYFDRITQISERLMMLLSLALGKEATYLDQFYRNKNHEKSASSFLRLNYYPVSPDPTSTMGVHHHTDAGGLTVLLQDDDVSSLQVFHRESQQWHLIPPKKDTYVINIGDMLQIWSNDRFVAPIHRVLANGSAERFSVPFFYNPSYDAIVEPVLQEANEEPKYRPLSWFDFRLKRFQGDYADLGEEVQITHYRV